MQVLERFRAKVAGSPLSHLGNSLAVQVSVGLATSIVDGRDTKELFERADESLYACKNNGRNQIRHFAAGEKISYQSDGLIENITRAYEKIGFCTLP